MAQSLKTQLVLLMNAHWEISHISSAFVFCRKLLKCEMKVKEKKDRSLPGGDDELCAGCRQRQRLKRVACAFVTLHPIDMHVVRSV